MKHALVAKLNNFLVLNLYNYTWSTAIYTVYLFSTVPVLCVLSVMRDMSVTSVVSDRSGIRVVSGLSVMSAMCVDWEHTYHIMIMISSGIPALFCSDVSRQARLSFQPLVSTVQDTVAWLDRQARRLHLASGRHLDYDFLLLHVDRDKPVLPISIPPGRRVQEVRIVHITKKQSRQLNNQNSRFSVKCAENV